MDGYQSLNAVKHAVASPAKQCRSNPVSSRGLPKREYFKCPPETIGYFALELAEFGVWRPTVNSQKPAIGRHFLIAEGKISRRRTVWRGWEDSNLEMGIG